MRTDFWNVRSVLVNINYVMDIMIVMMEVMKRYVLVRAFVKFVSSRFSFVSYFVKLSYFIQNI